MRWCAANGSLVIRYSGIDQTHLNDGQRCPHRIKFVFHDDQWRMARDRQRSLPTTT
jgi:hypothetical protein